MAVSDVSKVGLSGSVSFDNNDADMDGGETLEILCDIPVLFDCHAHKTFKNTRTVVTVRRRFIDSVSFKKMAGFALVLIPHAFQWLHVDGRFQICVPKGH